MKLTPGRNGVKLRSRKKAHRHSTETTDPPENKVIVRKKYPKAKCAYPGCTRNAVGADNVCKKHGGDPVVKENLLKAREYPVASLAQVKFIVSEHPAMFIEYSRQGMSDVEIAAEFGVGVQTLRGWAEKFEEFNTAYEIGQALYEAWWLKEGKAHLDDRSYNTHLYKFLTGNKLGYSDKIESKNLNIHAGVLMVPGQKVDPAEWEEFANEESS